MQDHALPQDVTGYKFHIIGNMTLKQFGEVAAGCIVGFLLYQTNLTPILKYPLVVIAAGAGAMVAFVPIEERPLDQWITAFFSALYRPTQYYWKRLVRIPEPFLYQPKSTMRTVVEDVDLTPARRQRVKDYLRSIDDKPSVADQFDQYTDQRLTEVMGEFGTQLTPALAYVEGNDEASLLSASPDSVSNTIDNLSFAGRGEVDEEQLATDAPTDQEVEMSNNVLKLFDTGTLDLPAPDTIPQYQPEPSPVFEPEPEQISAPAPIPEIKPETISAASPVIEPPQKPLPPPAPIPEPAPKPVPAPVAAPEPAPIVERKVVESSFVPPTPISKPFQEPPQPAVREVPQDMAELPDVSLTPERSQPEPAAIPQISTVFEGPATTSPTESIPKVETMAKYSLSSHPANADSTSVAEVADVIALAGSTPHRKGKNAVQFKNSRSSDGDKYETVLPHILDMTGTAPSVKIEQTPPPAPDKALPENKEVIVPEIEDIRITQTVKAPEDVKKTQGTGEMASAVDPSLLQAPEKQANVETSGGVTFNTDLPFPDKPSKPNKVVGMVLDQAGISQPNAIVEILSPDGIPARAVKTNPLGQFFIATPLNPGEYLITAEKEGLTFSTQQLSVTNKIIDPIEIRAN